MATKSEFKCTNKLIIGNGQGLHISHINNAFLTLKTSRNTTYQHKLALKDIHCVPYITKNLIIISILLANNDLTIEFYGVSCYIKDKNKEFLLLKGVVVKGSYKLLINSSKQTSSSMSIYMFLLLCYLNFNFFIMFFIIMWLLNVKSKLLFLVCWVLLKLIISMLLVIHLPVWGLLIVLQDL